jgi:hypothetical protein
MGGDTAYARDYTKTNLAIRIEDELDKLINMFSHAREALENEMNSGLGAKRLALSEKDVKKLKELTVGMNSLVESKIRYDKSRKAMAEVMTPAEERKAVVTYIRSLSYEDQRALRAQLIEYKIWPYSRCEHGESTNSGA